MNDSTAVNPTCHKCGKSIPSGDIYWWTLDGPCCMPCINSNHPCINRDDHTAALAAANAEIERLKAELADDAHEDAAPVIAALRAELATARAEAARNADATDALAGLERLGNMYDLGIAKQAGEWLVTRWEQGRPNYTFADTALAAVQAAEANQKPHVVVEKPDNPLKKRCGTCLYGRSCVAELPAPTFCHECGQDVDWQNWTPRNGA